MLDLLERLKKINNFNQKVYEIVRLIPRGKVMTYRQVALLAGSARASRAVGYALHQTNEEDALPWQRVVFKDGRLAFGTQQYDLLKAEGVRFDRSRKIKIKDFLWLSEQEIEELLWLKETI